MAGLDAVLVLVPVLVPVGVPAAAAAAAMQAEDVQQQPALEAWAVALPLRAQVVVAPESQAQVQAQCSQHEHESNPASHPSVHLPSISLCRRPPPPVPATCSVGGRAHSRHCCCYTRLR